MDAYLVPGHRGRVGSLLAILACAVAGLLAAPTGASATLAGTNGLIWTDYAPYLATYDPATKAIQKTNLPWSSFSTGRRDVSFSGDASRVTFASLSGDGFHVFVLPMTGGVPTDLTPGSGLDNYEPSFCGDGTIVFTRAQSSFARAQSTGVLPGRGTARITAPKSTLWAVSSAGGPARQITTGGTPVTGADPNAGSDRQPSCSKDGTVVFVRVGGSDRQLFKTNVSGATPTPLTNTGLNTFPDVSPDGTRIVYQGPAPDGQYGGFLTMPISGGTPEPVAGVGTDAPVSGSGATWSPDGKQLTYTRSKPFSGPVKLCTLDLASGTETVHTGTGPSLAWSPSPLTPMITKPSTYTVPTPTPTPTPGTGQPSQAAVQAALKSVGHPAAGTTLAKLLSTGAAVVPFTAPSAGTLNVTWSAAGPASRRAVAAKRTKIAAATETIAAAGKTKVKIKLTTAGKKALKKAKRAKRAVKVVSTAGFKPAGGTRTSATARFKLKP